MSSRCFWPCTPPLRPVTFYCLQQQGASTIGPNLSFAVSTIPIAASELDLACNGFFRVTFTPYLRWTSAELTASQYLQANCDEPVQNMQKVCDFDISDPVHICYRLK